MSMTTDQLERLLVGLALASIVLTGVAHFLRPFPPVDLKKLEITVYK